MAEPGAETILGRVTCSVLAVKPEGFVISLFNEGPDPAGIAEAILQVIANPASLARVPVGEEAVLGEAWKRSLDPAAFEHQVQAFFGLAG